MNGLTLHFMFIFYNFCSYSNANCFCLDYNISVHCGSNSISAVLIFDRKLLLIVCC